MILSNTQQNEKKVYTSFHDGRMIKDMKITSSYIILRLYLDAFSVNDPLSSSASKGKILGVYYSPFSNLKIASKRSRIQTLCLIESKDVSEYGLSKCLETTMTDLKDIVINGIFDKKLKMVIQVRVLCCLGDNLGQNEVAGLLLNFSKRNTAAVGVCSILVIF